MKRPNGLAGQTSPYLLQHQHNPVDWHPWGPEALELSRREDRPILLSVGYSACHWCHVMERECFEDDVIAAEMNRLYVCIKVDREERPDVDNLYQTAVQLQRRSGGWPLTVFLLPDGRPFYAGTYFPPEPRHGLPGFGQVLTQVHRAYTERRDEVEKAGSAIANAIVRVQTPGEGDLAPALVDEAVRALLGRMDTEEGGFGEAPKFPSVPALSLLWRGGSMGGEPEDAEQIEVREASAAAVLLTLDRMARGGIYDHIGGGWHRYSTDGEWLAPHFEKMLYDQALLVPIYVDAARWCERQGQPDPTLPTAARRACDWVLREMTSPESLFYCATDADSEGIEGKFFVWSKAEVDSLLGPDAPAFCEVFDITPRGNWEGKNIARLKLPIEKSCERLGIEPSALAPMVKTLFDARAKRIPPMLDDKVLVSWNALMITALLSYSRRSDDPRYRTAALRAANAIFSLLMVDGDLAHSRCKGLTAGAGFLDDHAALGLACLHLVEAGEGPIWLDRALGLAIAIHARFSTPEGYFQTADGADPLFVRPRDTQDSALPSGTGLAASFFLRLHAHTSEIRWLGQVEHILAGHAGQMDQNPFGTSLLLATLDAYDRGFTEVVVNAPELRTVALSLADPDTVVLSLEALPPDHPAAGGRTADQPTAWVCRGQTCSLPVHDADGLRGRLNSR